MSRLSCALLFIPNSLVQLHHKVKLLAISSSLTMGVFGTIKEIVQVRLGGAT